MHHETETYSQYFFFLIFFLDFIWFPLQCNIFTPNKPKNKVSTKKKQHYTGNRNGSNRHRQ